MSLAALMQKLFRSDTPGSTSALRMSAFLIEADYADTLALFASLTEKLTVAAKSPSLVGPFQAQPEILV